MQQSTHTGNPSAPIRCTRTFRVQELKRTWESQVQQPFCTWDFQLRLARTGGSQLALSGALGNLTCFDRTHFEFPSVCCLLQLGIPRALTASTRKFQVGLFAAVGNPKCSVLLHLNVPGALLRALGNIEPDRWICVAGPEPRSVKFTFKVYPAPLASFLCSLTPIELSSTPEFNSLKQIITWLESIAGTNIATCKWASNGGNSMLARGMSTCAYCDTSAML